MKITLKNFRCYENSTFDFGEKGVALLSGKSGAGKSGIFLGIYFALFGTGTKLTMYDKTSCSVTVEFEDIVVTRTKKPNRLVIDYEDVRYEDDAAQSIINKKFGETFQTTGYICQNATNSFIMMSPIEKLGFLEKFAFKDTNLLEIKTRCKNVINQRYEVLLKTTSQIEMVSSTIKELKEPEYMEFPLKNGTKNMPIKLREKSIQNTQIKYKNSNILISKCIKNIKLLEKELHSLELLETKTQSKQDSIISINEKLSILITELDNYTEPLQKDIDNYKDQLSFLITQKELMTLQIRYEDDMSRLNNMKKNELSDILEKIKIIEKDLWVDHTEEEAMSIIYEHKLIIKDLEKIKELQNDISRFIIDEKQLTSYLEEIEELKKELDIKKKLQNKLEMQKKIYECPSCNKTLKFTNGDKLQIIEAVELIVIDPCCLEEDIIKIKKSISRLENIITSQQNKLHRFKEIEKNISDITSQYLDDVNRDLPDLIEIKSEIEYIKKYTTTQQTLEKEKNSLKIFQKQIETNQKYSYSIESFESSVNTLKVNIDSLVQKIGKLMSVERGCDEEDIRNKIISAESLKIRIYDLKKNIKDLNEEKKDYEKQIEIYKGYHIQDFQCVRKISIVDSELTEKQKEFTELEKKKEELEKDIHNIHKFQAYEKDLESYNTWIHKLKILEKKENEDRKQYGASIMLKEKILEAESISMLNIISSINTHAQVYLETFFPDNPISVRLVSFKETKKGKNITKKPQINLNIEYKGMEADLTSLSGGETSRVILAFTLALGEMFNTPIMLLDECTASLDQELTGEVIDGIRNNFNGKLVIVIAHQEIKGSYDTVVEI